MPSCGVFKPLCGAAGRAAALVCSAADSVLSSVPAWRAADPRDPIPAVFIIGAPRSGSTLLFQCMVYARRYAYIPNIADRFPRSVCAITRLSRAGRIRPRYNFTSTYGDTRGLYGPSEAGAFWDRVFPWTRHHSVEADELPARRVREVRAVVSELVRQYGGPFLCKNLWHSDRLGALNGALPHAVFIVVRRDPLMTAQSILRGRRNALGDALGFWSFRPRALLAHEADPPPVHVAWQIVHTYRAIDRGMQALGRGRFHEVSYEQLCDEPDCVLEAIDRFLEPHKIHAERTGDIGRKFQAADRIVISDEDARAIQDVFDRAGPGAGALNRVGCGSSPALAAERGAAG